MDPLRRAAAQALAHPVSHRVVYTAGVTALVALLAYSRHCYREWYALGEGGIPRTPGGWLINVAAHLVARRDHRAVPAPYEQQRGKKGTAAVGEGGEGTIIALPSRHDKEKYDAHTRASFLPAALVGEADMPMLPAHGPRPAVPDTVVPQRQTSHTAGAATIAAQEAYLRAVAEANPRLFAVRPSALESPKFNALWLAGSPSSPSDESDDTAAHVVDPARVRWFPRAARGEVAHVHDEGSTHVCLSLVDAAEVVRRGWGERHKLSGVKDILPWGYVLVYAPRAGGRDWDVWKGIVVAGARVAARSAGFEGGIVVPE
ncbi:hypothetical protein F4802DRAFT_96 [Xylaria palmicola]|nr:hypothetical protein F4802DRAFT_96 [Xylaria palmicola]